MHWSEEAKDTIWLIGLQGANYLVPLLVWRGAEPLTVLLGKDYSGIGSLAGIMAVVPVLIAVGGVQGQMVFWNANTLIKYKTKAIEKWRITYCS